MINVMSSSQINSIEVGFESTPKANQHGWWVRLYVLGGAAILGSFLARWWMDANGLTLETPWPKVTLAGGLVTLFTGFLVRRRPPMATLLVAGPTLVAISLVAFYFRVVKTEFFSDWEFTRFVEAGFFIAMMGFTWAAGSALMILVAAGRGSWRGALAWAVACAALVLALNSWTGSNARSITGATAIQVQPLSALSRANRAEPVFRCLEVS